MIIMCWGKGCALGEGISTALPTIPTLYKRHPGREMLIIQIKLLARMDAPGLKMSGEAAPSWGQRGSCHVNEQEPLERSAEGEGKPERGWGATFWEEGTHENPATKINNTFKF